MHHHRGGFPRGGGGGRGRGLPGIAFSGPEAKPVVENPDQVDLSSDEDPAEQENENSSSEETSSSDDSSSEGSDACSEGSSGEYSVEAEALVHDIGDLLADLHTNYERKYNTELRMVQTQYVPAGCAPVPFKPFPDALVLCSSAKTKSTVVLVKSQTNDEDEPNDVEVVIVDKDKNPQSPGQDGSMLPVVSTGNTNSQLAGSESEDMTTNKGEEKESMSEPLPVVNAESNMALSESEPLPVVNAESDMAPSESEPLPVVNAESNMAPSESEPLPVVNAESDMAPSESEPLPVVIAESDMAPSEREPLPVVNAESDMAPSESEPLPVVNPESNMAPSQSEPLPFVNAESDMAPVEIEFAGTAPKLVLVPYLDDDDDDDELIPVEVSATADLQTEIPGTDRANNSTKLIGHSTLQESMPLAYEFAEIDARKLPCVRDGRILLVGQPELTYVITSNLMGNFPMDNILQCEPSNLLAVLEQHRKEGMASKWKHFIYMVNCDEDFNDYKVALAKHLCMLLKSYVDDRRRVDVLLCRSTNNLETPSPPQGICNVLSTKLRLFVRPLLYDIPAQLECQLEYLTNRYVLLATERFKYINCKKERRLAVEGV